MEKEPQTEVERAVARATAPVQRPPGYEVPHTPVPVLRREYLHQLVLDLEKRVAALEKNAGGQVDG